jgi:NADH:ubiquinone oxidoreductase subunit 4 (subunit M)
VFFGEVTHPKNRELADASTREKWILATMVVVTLWMGIGSPFFTRRITVPCNAVLEQMKRSDMQEAVAPIAPALPAAGHAGNSVERLASR